jgi:hypothetical protein
MNASASWDKEAPPVRAQAATPAPPAGGKPVAIPVSRPGESVPPPAIEPVDDAPASGLELKAHEDFRGEELFDLHASPSGPEPKGPGEKYCHDCGAIIRVRAEACPKCGVRQPPAQPPPPAERCYDCGLAIPEGEVCRREVEVSSSHTSGSISTASSGSSSPRSGGGRTWDSSGSTFGTYGGSSSTYAKVSLCPECDAERDEAERRRRKAETELLLGCLAVFIVAVIIAFGALILFSWRAEVEQKTAAQAKAEAQQKHDKAEAPEHAEREKAAAEAEAEAKRKREEAAKRAAAEAERKRRKAEAKKAAADEEIAGERLRYARTLIDQGMDELAKERLQRIIKEFPTSKAAAEAKELLKRLDG